jgi:plastocyanin
MKLLQVPMGTKQFLFLSILLLFIYLPFLAKTPAKVHKVEIKGMKFIPAEVTVHKGDTIVWTNNDIVVHNVTETSNKAWKASPIQVGKTWKMAVGQSAEYFCSFHPTMKGKISVK